VFLLTALLSPWHDWITRASKSRARYRNAASQGIS
jgi:hypothetical protein